MTTRAAKFDDDELIPTRASLLAGLKYWDNAERWQDFFNTYWRLIYGRARRAQLTEQEAQEVVQETVISVAKQIPEFHYDPAVCAFKTWLFRIVSRRIADQFRKRRRAGPTLEPLADDDEGASFESIADPASLLPDAAWEMEWEENLIAAAMERVKRRLKPVQFQIFDYHVLQKHGALDTARHLRTNVASVYVAKHRVGQVLKREVEALRNGSNL